MIGKYSRVAALAGLAIINAHAALAGAADYEFQPVSAEINSGPGSELAVRLIDKRTGKAVRGAVVTRTQLDMSPDSMGEMLAKHEAIASTELDVYRFRADVTMSGRWAFKLEAKLPGEPATVEGSVVFTARPPSRQEPSAERKILYYRNPMGLPDTSPVPKKDWMGMDYIPVYDGEDEDGTTVKVSLDKVQRAGVRAEEVRRVSLARPVRAPGIAKPDERTLRVISLRADAFIEKLYVAEKGKHVKAGEPLFRVYSPEFLRALVEAKSSSIAGVISAEQKLRILEIPPQAIAEAKAAKEVLPSFDYPSPASGFVMEKNVVEGMMMRMGEPLYRLVDLSSIWVIASVAEQDLARISIDDPAKVSFRALPGETFDGKVTFVLHELEKETRTASVRIEIKNPDHRIKHEMYADVEIDGAARGAPTLAVPAEAVIDSGNRQVVLVEKGEGRFEPRAVKPGRRGDGMIEITDGIAAGEKVVVSANFLIDAESNLKAALAAFVADDPQPAAGKPSP